MEATVQGTTKKRRPKVPAATKAATAIDAAIDLGNVKAARAIGRTFVALEQLGAQIRDERKTWSERIGAGKATLRGAIMADDDGTEACCRSKNAATVMALQEVDEAEAGRKDALSLLLEKRKELTAMLNQQVSGARQLGLFD